ncbi:hypothetical protein P700755_001368 [Psychroflexus torquis ATCC 700755]|uniref:Transposase IS801/IS1294 domain-containing protein n=1 Tax=Psychroflexus torquis (strain ATCC 700755 / CIP 106069 / ACAM 623) TaxID=313595 RepID=K4ID05_PSYTT|nr:hypothetical protein P700755_001368 [Psychroflexus torquis ATCC 700755]
MQNLLSNPSTDDCCKIIKKTTLTLSTKEFIQRFQFHILSKGFTRIRHYGFLSSSWKKEKLPLLQLQLRDKNLAHILTFATQEKSLHRCCPSCKKETLITLFTYDSRWSPKDYKQIIKDKLEYKH